MTGPRISHPSARASAVYWGVLGGVGILHYFGPVALGGCAAAGAVAWFIVRARRKRLRAALEQKIAERLDRLR